MPLPAMPHAINAPKGPVACPKLRGREKIPAPTMPPTTMAVRVKRGTFGLLSDELMPALEDDSGNAPLQWVRRRPTPRHWTLVQCFAPARRGESAVASARSRRRCDQGTGDLGNEYQRNDAAFAA